MEEEEEKEENENLRLPDVHPAKRKGSTPGWYMFPEGDQANAVKSYKSCPIISKMHSI